MPPHSLISSSRFEDDISLLRFSTPPLSSDAVSGAQVIPVAKRTRKAQNLLAHMEQAISGAAEPKDSRFAVSPTVETHNADNRAPDGEPIKYGKGPGAAKVPLTEENIRQGWPADCWALVLLVQKFALSLKQNRACYVARKTLCLAEIARAG